MFSTFFTPFCSLYSFFPLSCHLVFATVLVIQLFLDTCVHNVYKTLLSSIFERETCCKTFCVYFIFFLLFFLFKKSTKKTSKTNESYVAQTNVVNVLFSFSSYGFRLFSIIAFLWFISAHSHIPQPYLLL